MGEGVWIMKISPFKALTHSTFRNIWFAMFVSRIGTEMQNVAINWHIYTLTKSPFALGLIGLFRIAPIILFSLLGGIVADHVNRKKLLLVTQFLSLLFAGILTIVTFQKINNITFLYILIALNASITAFDNPARQSMFPHLVPKEDFMNAVSLNSISYQASLIFGPAVGGFVIAYFGVGSNYLCNAVSFIGVIFALLSLSIPHIPSSENTLSLDGLKKGIRFVKHTPLLWSTMFLDFFATLFGSAMILMPIFATEILHVGPKGLGFLYAAPSIGAIVTGLIFSSLGKTRGQGKTLFIGIVLYAFATIIFGLSTFFFLSLLALFFVGAGDMISSIIRNTLRQMITPDKLRGRMISINMIFYMGGPQLGELESGLLASFIGAPLTVAIGGIGTILAAVFMMKIVPSLRKYDNHENTIINTE